MPIKQYMFLMSVLLVHGCGIQTTPSEIVESNRLDSVLPKSSDALVGKLDNGLTYLIKRNNRPEKTAELRLIVRVGSIMEDDNQRGFAHFVEHMAFRGTEDFPAQSIQEYIESIGLKSGQHLNATTSFENTIFKLSVPTDNDTSLAAGMHIMENWAHKVSFDTKEINRERGVIIEEYRTRKGVNRRIANKHFSKQYQSTIYAERDPIGTQQSILHGTRRDIVHFYEKWYRPELMSIVVVGDVDPLKTEEVIQKYFVSIPRGKKPEKQVKSDTRLPILPLRASIETDSEIPQTKLKIIVNHSETKSETFEDYRLGIVSNLFLSQLRARLNELGVDHSSPLALARASYRPGQAKSNTFELSTQIKQGYELESAFKALLREVYRVGQHGFTNIELAETKKFYLNFMRENVLTDYEISSSHLATSYVSSLLNEQPYYSNQQQLGLWEELLPTITVEDFKQVAQSILTQQNSTIIISAPEKNKNSLLNKDELIELWDAVALENLEQKVITLPPDNLMNVEPESGEIVKKSFDDINGAHVWQLSNGATVVLKATTFEKNKILFEAISPGGRSILDAETLYKTHSAFDFIGLMGVGELNADNFNKFMRNKTFRLYPKIYSEYEGLKGDCTREHLLNFMQLLHLRMTAPRKDKKRHDFLISLRTPRIKNQYVTPKGQFQQAVRNALYSGIHRSTQYDINKLKAQDLDASFRFYNERFSNAADFTFVFVGDMDISQMERLVSTYIASLPSLYEKESAVFHPKLYNQGQLDVEVKKGKENKATVLLETRGSMDWSFNGQLVFNALIDTLKVNLTRRLREEMSAVYGVNVIGSYKRAPDTYYKIAISFDCNPAHIDEIRGEVEGIVKQLQMGEFSHQDIENFKLSQIKKRKKNLKQNWFWVYHLKHMFMQEKPQPIADYLETIQSISPEEVRIAAVKYFDSPNKLTAKLLPED